MPASPQNRTFILNLTLADGYTITEQTFKSCSCTSPYIIFEDSFV
ncbi:hypothetical protein Ptr902_06922 [Pyrenophora tritici-repentis]|nr:hypothetical protein Ptr902_06922 [Pyrenophora tritici-repentis]